MKLHQKLLCLAGLALAASLCLWLRTLEYQQPDAQETHWRQVAAAIPKPAPDQQWVYSDLQAEKVMADSKAMSRAVDRYLAARQWEHGAAGALGASGLLLALAWLAKPAVKSSALS